MAQLHQLGTSKGAALLLCVVELPPRGAVELERPMVSVLPSRESLLATPMPRAAPRLPRAAPGRHPCPTPKDACSRRRPPYSRSGVLVRGGTEADEAHDVARAISHEHLDTSAGTQRSGGDRFAGAFAGRI